MDSLTKKKKKFLFFLAPESGQMSHTASNTHH
jgi:hypothetical protein